jgi:hypothetical protein
MISYEDVRKLKYYATDFALMMDDVDIDEVIAAFVEVRNQRTGYRSRLKNESKDTISHLD